MRIILYIFLFLGGAFKGISQTVIAYGTDLTGSIGVSGEIDSYTFEGEAGDLVLLRMRGTANGVDACVSLLNATGDILAIECNSGLSTFTYNLPEDGNYTIQASDNNDNDIGEYGLSLEILNKLTAAIAIEECDANITSTLIHRAEVDAYSFSVGIGEQLRIRMRGIDEHIEARFQLYNSAGTLIVTSQLFAGIADSEPILITETGDYLLLAMDHRGNDTGSYGMSVERILSNECAVAIGCGADFTGELTSFAQIDAYRFEAEAGDVITALMRGIPMELEGFMELYDPLGNRIATSVSYEHLSRIDPVVLPSAGTYKILAMDNSGNDIGEYAFSLQFTNAATCVIDANCSNKEESHRLSLYAEIDAYGIQGRVGDVINLEAIEIDAHLELRIELYAPDGSKLKANTGRHSAVIEKYELQQDGQYTILVMDNEGNDQGNYILNINTPILEEACVPLYCESYGQSTAYEWIESATINDIENVSGNDSGYGNYTGITIGVNAGGYYIFSVTPGINSSSGVAIRECYRVWIDLNQDNDFDDEGELLYRGSAYGTINGSMVIPEDAMQGTTRMRISMSYTSYPQPCETITFGEVEDYTIEILPTISCGNLPSTWLNQDVGDPNISGSACYQDATESFVVSSNGYDIYKKEDEFQFVYTAIENNDNLSIVARVTSITNSGSTALAGIMMRESLDEDAKNILLAVSPEEGGFFQYRSRTNKNTKSQGVNITAPYWMKLKREGNKFTAYVSADGIDWTYVNSVEVSMSKDFYIGLAVSSFNEDVVNVASFDNVSFYNNTGLQSEDEELAINRTKEETQMLKAIQRQFIVYPNPGRGHLFVTTDAVRSKTFRLVLYSTAGQRILSREFTKDNSGQVQLSWPQPLPSGHYRLILQDGDEAMTQNVVIIE